MNLNTFLIIAIAVALIGSMVGASMVAIEKSKNSTTPQENSNRNFPSRREIFLPMVSVLGLSFALLIIGYGSGNIVASAVGFLFLFFGFGIVGSFLFRNIF
ncbi:hypothetical protein [Gloeocapsa sp. PCC 73106]|uniref:hypothetical protein n=1 Tax=Gloeocapsa sp. PCC 73106 TaxID=102232 RepID=UPI0002AB9B16|nr:hypothetical protein [Gloeocapsa sp. PCC 73106]ELR99656.1 hypothetical protein GLO73106DRAFT_00035080 [Gloeocapsa sp. PCC 73106]